MSSKFNAKQVVGVAAFAVTCAAVNLTYAVLANIMQTYSGESPVVVQTLTVTPALVGAIFAFAVGSLNKKVPSRTLMLLCELAVVFVGPIFYFGGGVLPIGALIVTVGLFGFGLGAMNVFIGLQLFNAIEDEKKRATWTGIIVAINNIGGMFFSTAGGVVANASWQAAYLLPAAVSAIAFMMCLFLLPKSAPEGAGAPAATAEDDGALAKRTGGMGRVWLISLHYFAFMTMLYVFGTNVSEFVVSTHALGTATEAGLGMSMFTLGGTLAGLLFGAYSRVLKKTTVPVMMLCTFAGITLCVLFKDSILAVYAAGVLCGFGGFGLVPYIINVMHDVVPHESRYGQAMSIFAGCMNVGMVLAVYILAFLAQLLFGDGTSVDAKFLIAAVGTAIMTATAFPIYLSIKHKGEK